MFIVYYVVDIVFIVFIPLGHSSCRKKKLNLIICNGGFSSFNSCTNWLKFMPAFVCKNLLLYLWL